MIHSANAEGLPSHGRANRWDVVLGVAMVTEFRSRDSTGRDLLQSEI
jgi:hypothetical protein